MKNKLKNNNLNELLLIISLNDYLNENVFYRWQPYALAEQGHVWSMFQTVDIKGNGR